MRFSQELSPLCAEGLDTLEEQVRISTPPMRPWGLLLEIPDDKNLPSCDSNNSNTDDIVPIAC